MSDETFVDRDFVYMGERIGVGNVRIVALGVIEGGAITKPFYLKWSRDWKIKCVGGVYTGATFSDTQVKGAVSAKYASYWPNDSERIEWTAKQNEALDEQESKRLEKKLSGTDDIDKALMPLRRVYWKLTASQREAFERAVLRSLRKLT